KAAARQAFNRPRAPLLTRTPLNSSLPLQGSGPGARIPGIQGTPLSVEPRNAWFVVENHSQEFLLAYGAQALFDSLARHAPVAGHCQNKVAEIGKDTDVRDIRHRGTIQDDVPLPEALAYGIYQVLHLCRREGLGRDVPSFSDSDHAKACNAHGPDDLAKV